MNKSNLGCKFMQKKIELDMSVNKNEVENTGKACLFYIGIICGINLG